LRGPADLLLTYRDFHTVEADLLRRKPEGLLKTAFLVDSSRSCFSLSVWASETAIARFGADADAHTRVARGVFPRLRFVEHRPELWSTKWRLTAVSGNLNWAGATVVPRAGEP
jgi:hypothetical protein